MKIDRKMASYLLEIKRNLPYDMREQFKLSSPNIEELVFDIHQNTKSEKLKELARCFLQNSGDHWAQKLDRENSHSLMHSFDIGKSIKLSEALNQSAMIVDKMVSAVSKQITTSKTH